MKRDVAIIGAGYVGLPLARTFADAGKQVLLVDVDAARVERLNAGESYIEDRQRAHERTDRQGCRGQAGDCQCATLRWQALRGNRRRHAPGRRR